MTNQFWRLFKEFLKMKGTFPDALQIKASMNMISIDNIRVSWWNAFWWKQWRNWNRVCVFININWPTKVLFKRINTRLVIPIFSLFFTRMINLMSLCRDPCYHRSLNSTQCLSYKMITWNGLSDENSKTEAFCHSKCGVLNWVKSI